MRSALILSCHHCGALYDRPALEPGQWARCVRCDEVLENGGLFNAQAWLAVVLAAIVTFGVANVFPVATLEFQGSGQATTFLGAVQATLDAGYWEVALLTGLVGFGLPLFKLVLLALLFIPIACQRVPFYFEIVLRLLGWVRPWCMVPVFLLGSLVAIVKLVDLAQLTVGLGLYATAASAVFFTALSRLTPSKIRYLVLDADLVVMSPQPEPAPSPSCLPKAWALLLAAAILYIPANALPVMTITAISGSSGHTILGGVIELAQMGSWDIAAVVFIASVFVPIFKILLLGTLLWLTQQRSARGLKRRTRLYRLVEAIGQWSMLDVFVVILLVSLGQFGRLLDIEPGAGAVAFGAVVVLTMLCAMTFDSRLAWRWAGYRRQVVKPDVAALPVT
ncbi:paraquat-inducible protein A [Orrella daihaiensis]|uniref:Paraquat-inducible protein A n=1 Tax=Orrella daihaiensis TaxID=2782176 RepID=A0ABY4AHD4_9BURK|nr:paraquat-inducible protein A [Orrella daihaiensis]UOD49696.1 paraquat-inducible protein A [Orrella daihaiensis]